MDGLKYTVLFGGGAVRGMAYAGAQKAMEELGLNATAYGGASVGSITAALLAVGYNAAELKDIFMEINFNLFKDIQLSIGSRPALSKGNVFLNWVRKLIEKKVPGKRPVTFADLDKDLTIITTNIADYSCQEFSRKTTPDFEVAKAVRISCSMPGLMRPVEYGDAVLVDGDLQKGRPMWQLLGSTPAGRVLEFRLEGSIKHDELTAKNFVNTVYSCMTAVSTEFVVDVYGQNDKFDCIVLDTGGIVLVDFNMPREKREELVQSGYEHTIEYFKRTLPAKKQKILAEHKLIASHLSRVKKYAASGKVLKARQQLSELFEGICVSENIVSCDDLTLLKDLRKTFIAGIKYPALFGKIKLNNPDQILALVDFAGEKTGAKIKELEKAIKILSARG